MKFSEIARTLYYSLGVIAILVGTGTWLWNRVLPQRDFEIYAKRSENVLPRTVSSILSDAKWKYDIGGYVSISLRNISSRTATDVEIVTESNGYAEVQSSDGSTTDAEFHDRLQIGDVPPLAKVDVQIWENKLFAPHRSIALVHASGTQIVLEREPLFSWGLYAAMIAAIAGYALNGYHDVKKSHRANSGSQALP